jgi:hypothetical protein
LREREKKKFYSRKGPRSMTVSNNSLLEAQDFLRSQYLLSWPRIPSSPYSELRTFLYRDYLGPTLYFVLSQFNPTHHVHTLYLEDTI